MHLCASAKLPIFSNHQLLTMTQMEIGRVKKIRVNLKCAVLYNKNFFKEFNDLAISIYQRNQLKILHLSKNKTFIIYCVE